MSGKNGAGYNTDIEDVGVSTEEVQEEVNEVEESEEQKVTVPLTDNELDELMFGESLSFLFKVKSTGETIELVVRKGTDDDYPLTYKEATE